MKNLSLILPTREHPILVKRLFDSLVQTVSDPEQMEIVLYVDDDDVENHHISHPSLNIITKIGPSPRKTMGNIIKDCYNASSGRYVMLINDDVVFRTKKWDAKLLEAFSRFDDEVALVYGRDCYYDKEMCTFPALSRTTCDLMDGICPGDYDSHCIDSHIFDTFKQLAEIGHDRAVYLPDVVFEHMHYESGASAYENKFERTNDQNDQSVYLALAAKRQNTAKKMAQYIASCKNPAANTNTGKIEKDKPAVNPVAGNMTKPSSPPVVSLIMPVNQDSLEYAVACLKAALDDNSDNALSLEFVIVLSDADEDNLRFPKRIKKKTTVVLNEYTSTAGALNSGASAAKGDYLVFLSSKSVPKKGWIGALWQTAQDEKAGIVGSKWLNSRTGRIEHFGIGFHKDNGVLRKSYLYRGLAANHPAVNSIKEIQAVRSVGMFVKKDVFLNVGCFDETYPGVEDIDLCLKVRQSGRKVLCAPNANLYCEGQNTGEDHSTMDAGLEALNSKWNGQIKCDLEDLLEKDGFILRSHVEKSYVCPSRNLIDGLADTGNNCTKSREFLEETLELVKNAGGDNEDMSAICRKLVDVYISLGRDDDLHKIYRLMQDYGLSAPVTLGKYENLTRADKRNLGTVTSVDMYAGTRFVIPVPASVSKIQMKMYKQGSPDDDIAAFLYRDHEGPSDPVGKGGSKTVRGKDIASDPTGQWVDFTFSKPVPLRANTYYWVVLHRTGRADNANYYRILLDSSPECKYPYASDYYGAMAINGNISARISQLFRVTGSVAPHAPKSKKQRNNKPPTKKRARRHE
ncbi:MAG: glycosyltransferase [Sedimentisphaerales bacterium]|nr:glycosyltransferase [Sedimentisphaerales bacterium]